MLIPVSGMVPDLPSDVQELISRRGAILRSAVSGSSEPAGDAPAAGAAPVLRSTSEGRPAQVPKAAPTSEEANRVPQLEYWTIQAHAYSNEVAAKVGILGRLFGGEATVVAAGVIHEAKRFTRLRTGEGRETEFGVAVRIFAAAINWDAALQLTLPTLAADAQLHARDARIAMEVIGYSGPLGSLLPAPRQLDVSSLADYLGAFQAIQAEVFGEKGLRFLAPTVLSYQEAV
jgi:hypothetical protein